jgi:hypothetical protein
MASVSNWQYWRNQCDAHGTAFESLGSSKDTKTFTNDYNMWNAITHNRSGATAVLVVAIRIQYSPSLQLKP